MYLKRSIDDALLAWKHGAEHKPLLVRGARQVGKSRAIRHLGESFKYYIEVNFEKRPELKELFISTRNVKELCAKLSLLYDTPIAAGDTLLFLDEIQTSPDALKSLWFFKEDYPELHVVAAGSLLEFALQDISSYGVGRIKSMFMYPMSFAEFMDATGHGQWKDVIKGADYKNPVFEILHNDIVQLYRTFILVGGMPASVVAWVSTGDFFACEEELSDIQTSFYDDFPKYSKNCDSRCLRNTLVSVVAQLGGKFTYSKVPGGYSAADIKKALLMLSDAGLIKPVYSTAANGLPLGAEINDKFTKYIYLDSGLLLRILDLDLGGADQIKESILAGTAADLVNKGDLTELVTGWEFVKASSPTIRRDLFYWENSSRGATSEVDYVVARKMKIVPVEVKSGTSGKMKSLRLFMEKKKITYAIRTSLENFGRLEYKYAGSDEVAYIDILPLYAIFTLG